MVEKDETRIIALRGGEGDDLCGDDQLGTQVLPDFAVCVSRAITDGYRALRLCGRIHARCYRAIMRPEFNSGSQQMRQSGAATAAPV